MYSRCGEAEWAVRRLLSWLRPSLLVRVLSLLLCEAKVVVAGEFNMVYHAVYGVKNNRLQCCIELYYKVQNRNVILSTE